MKSCIACKQILPEQNFYSYWCKSRNKSRVRARCKTCEQPLRTSQKKSYQPLHYRDLNSRLKNLVTKAKNRSKQVSPTLSWEYLLGLWLKQEGKCKYSGLPLSFEANHPDTVSLDRIDSSLGYTEGNLQLVSATVNKIKLNLDEVTFLRYSELIANNLSKTTQGAGPQETDPLKTPLSKLAS